ncbi:hypothetical protein O0L34_g1250 [Tuta absoluta]|nr:hypothetical protein O0L34_g1250 [Tuta absoluta]
MGVNITEFETFEKELLKLIEELETVTSSECRLREALRVECTRSEAAEAARDGALRAEAEARSAAAAATISATHAAAALAKTQDELAATKMQFELAERHRAVLEEKCSELSNELESLRRELQKLRPLQAAQGHLQRQYTELQERIHTATADARKEATRLEAELRRVEKSASAGAEIRERARLAAAAHVRERRLAAAELQHTSHELHKSKAEATKLGALVAELQCRLSKLCSEDLSKGNHLVNPHEEALVEARAALEAERAGAARLERALAAALADNATLASKLNATDNPVPASQINREQSEPDNASSTNICPIDSFLAD